MNIDPAHFSNMRAYGTFLQNALTGRILDVECNGDSNTRYPASTSTASDIGRGGGFAGGLAYAAAPADCGGLGILGTYGTGFLFAGAGWDSNAYLDFGVIVMNAGYRPISTKSLLVNGALSGGESSINLDAGSVTGTLFVGDKITIAGTTYTVTADNTASGNAFTGVAITPTIAGAVADNAAATVVYNDNSNGIFGHGLTQAAADIRAYWDPCNAAGNLGNSCPLTIKANVVATGQVGLQLLPGGCSLSTNRLFVNNGGGYASGTVTMNIDANGGTVTGVLVPGDQFAIGGSFSGSSRVYTISSYFKAAANAFASVTFLPELGAAVADNATMDTRPSGPRGCPVPIGDDWLFHFWIGTYSGGGGTFVPMYRPTATGTLVHFNEGSGAVVDCTRGGQSVVQRITRTILAANLPDLSDQGAQIYLSGSSNTIDASSASPVHVMGYRVENKTALGIAVSQCVEKPGKHFRQMYLAVNALTAQQRGYLSDMLVYPQVRRGLTPYLLRLINGGHNDYPSASLSLDGVNSDQSVPGFTYNFREYLRIIRAKDQAAYDGGFTTLNPANIYTVVFGPHRIADSASDPAPDWTREQAYATYRTAIAAVAAEAEFVRHSVWDIASVHTAAEWVRASYYDLAGRLHQAPEGWFRTMGVFAEETRQIERGAVEGLLGGGGSGALRIGL